MRYFTFSCKVYVEVVVLQQTLFQSSVCLDIVLRQNYIVKVRVEKLFISCLFIMLNRAALDHWKWIYVMYWIMI